MFEKLRKQSISNVKRKIKESVSKDVILLTPDLPASKAFQVVLESNPNGLMIPIPVITVLWSI